jgi:hypothetical protein
VVEEDCSAGAGVDAGEGAQARFVHAAGVIVGGGLGLLQGAKSEVDPVVKTTKGAK